jgi:AbrB family looped-hinge helix DNA binding protein
MLKKSETQTTRLSTKGQVILPKDLREKRGWKPGAEFVVEERPEGVLLKLGSGRRKVTIDEVAGCLGPVDRARSIEEMDEGVRREVIRRWNEKSSDRD